MAKSIMDYPTVDFDRENNKLVIIDQTKLPETIEMLRLDKQEDIFEAIYLLKVRGAPAIGVAAAYGVYLASREIDAVDYDEFFAEFKKKKDYLASSRPTAVNLFWALNRMEASIADRRDKTPASGASSCGGNRNTRGGYMDVQVHRRIWTYAYQGRRRHTYPL